MGQPGARQLANQRTSTGAFEDSWSDTATATVHLDGRNAVEDALAAKVQAVIRVAARI